MDHMLALLGDHQPCFLLKELFLQQVPDHVRLAVTNSVSVSQRQPTTIPTTVDEGDIRPLSVSATVVTRRVKSSGLCFYHAKFGTKATKCLPPCNFGVSGNALAGTCPCCWSSQISQHLPFRPLPQNTARSIISTRMARRCMPEPAASTHTSLPSQ